MLNEKQILRIATTAADVAAALFAESNPLLGPDYLKYSVDLINDPSFPEDALFNTQESKVLINLAQLQPFPPEFGGDSDDVRLAFKVIFLAYHEMRHAYQRKALEVYTLNQMMGGGFPLLESKKKCELWLKEMAPAATNTNAASDCEQDADAFAWYLLSRSPVEMPLVKTNRHIGIMKRKYDKFEVPDLWRQHAPT